MLKRQFGHRLTPIINDAVPKRRGVYKARELGRPARTPMFWAFWGGKRGGWGPVTRYLDDAAIAYVRDPREDRLQRRCAWQGILK